jgi:hypothetical protein
MQKSILQRPKFDIVACHLLGFLVAMGLISMDAFTMKRGSGSSFLVTSVSSTPDSETSLIHSAAARTASTVGPKFRSAAVSCRTAVLRCAILSVGSTGGIGQ